MLSYTLTILLSAALLFTVQPFMAKLLLPRLGGSPSVWNTCMVFFQATLLAGYTYTYLLTRRLSLRVQITVHGVVCLLPLSVLPLVVSQNSAPSADQSPWLWLMGMLAVSVGLPFFVLATTGPLLQSWFAATDHPQARDPYFLYAASNLGSLAGLLSYPFLLEPLLRLNTPDASLWMLRLRPMSQSVLWSLGYVLFAVLVCICGVTAIRRAVRVEPDPFAEDSAPGGSSVSIAQRLRWVLLAFVPSSAMLGTTQYLTTDIAAIPLLWVVPLALYLVTMMIAFSRRLRISPPVWATALAVLTVVVAASFWGFGPQLVWLKIPLHLMTLFAAGMLCHGLLADERPRTDRLTEFYLLVALGGVAGGAFNALAAPVLFTSVAEYPIILVMACLLRPSTGGPSGRGWHARVLDVALPMGLAGAIILLWNLIPRLELESMLKIELLQISAPCLICLLFMRRIWRFGLGLAVLFIAGWRQSAPLQYQHQERTFFGVHKVIQYSGRPYRAVDEWGRTKIVEVPLRVLVHGTTQHGSQALDERLSLVPTMYYHPSGPIGQVFERLEPGGGLRRVALVGLGVGTLAAYGKPGRSFTYYEIDPAVVRIARDEGFFTYLRNSKAESEFIVGDGRLMLGRAEDENYDLIVLDAFSSDAVPVHLLTREAVELYLQKLRPGGLLAIHLTNTYLDLRLVVDAISADLGLRGLVQWDASVTPLQCLESKNTSVWAVLAEDAETLAPLEVDSRWKVLPADPTAPVDLRYLWTDDYSNILSVLNLW
ncbi:MAG: fused MFS/spermidine synthase [Thermoanaerobaculales bacterium]|nr:fused MFS/spermidine synthase [Thermoanaerobaculales bacterium]